MIMTLRNYFFAACAFLALSCGRTLKDCDYTLTEHPTDEVHGTWFDSTYVDTLLEAVADGGEALR